MIRGPSVQKRFLSLHENWNVVNGNWQVNRKFISHKPAHRSNLVLPGPRDDDKIVINDLQTTDLELSADVQFSKSDSGFKDIQAQLVFRYSDIEHYCFAGLGGWYQRACVGMATRDGWRLIKSIGTIQDEDTKNFRRIKVRCIGDKVELYFGKAKVLAGTIPGGLPLSGNIGVRTFGMTNVKFSKILLAELRPRCFVAYDFKKSRGLYDSVIEPVLKWQGFEPRPADKVLDSQPIISKIVEEISSASLVIADITSGNNNVFYEAGIAHTFGKEIVFIGKIKKLPFDVKHIECREYEKGQEKRLKMELHQTIRNVRRRLFGDDTSNWTNVTVDDLGD